MNTGMKTALIVLYTITISAIVYLVVNGGSYYGSAILERPHLEQHNLFRPSGIIGHGIGIIGSLLMIILLTYSLRKRVRFLQNWGDIRSWLNIHIWMGITGPLLVIFHTSFKVHGIVAVSFWSMIAVALSGVLGRYLYLQIPRGLSGEELSDTEIKSLSRSLEEQIRQQVIDDDSLDTRLEEYMAPFAQEWKGSWADLGSWFTQDLQMPGMLRRMKRDLRSSGKFKQSEVKGVIALFKQQIILNRRQAFLGTAQRLLHHWHIIHKPFAIVMLLIMVIHVIVALLFGYRWIL